MLTLSTALAALAMVIVYFQIRMFQGR